MTSEPVPKKRRLSLTIKDESQLYDTCLSSQDVNEKTTHASQAKQGTSTLLAQPISPPFRKSIRKESVGPNEHSLSSGRVSPLVLNVEEKPNRLIDIQDTQEDKDPIRHAAAKEIDETSDAIFGPSHFATMEQDSSGLPYNRSPLQDASAVLSPGEKPSGINTRVIPSPIELNRVEGLSDYSNLDTVSLRDIVGDPLIKECWVFNYLFDVDFLLSNFDEDVQEVVEIKLVHGSWKKEDSNRLGIQEATMRYKNVKSITAHMPEAFGTHHSKMIINIRHDDTAQVNILTANMLSIDWTMSQAVWRSPLLTLLEWPVEPGLSSSLPAIGTGARFKSDLISYLKQYSSRLRVLINQLEAYCFDDIRAALIASVPSRQNLTDIDPKQETMWGWPGLRNILRTIPPTSDSKPHIVMQVSSVASLGSGDSWLRQTFQDILSAATNNNQSLYAQQKPKFSLIFPTADTVRRSIDGYRSGGSIHMKTHTTQGIKQLEYIRPILCHWAKDNYENGYVPTPASGSITRDAPKAATPCVGNAGRQRTVPHIKTYIRFADQDMNRIDWAMMTSANLSTQAWGAKTNAAKEVRICSYEIGVVVWPGLWGERAEMVPVFGTNEPESNQVKEAHKKGDAGRDVETTERKVHTLIGLRMPYDLPLIPYSEDEVPWCAALPDSEPDWKLRIWAGYRQT